MRITEKMIMERNGIEGWDEYEKKQLNHLFEKYYNEPEINNSWKECIMKKKATGKTLRYCVGLAVAVGNGDDIVICNPDKKYAEFIAKDVYTLLKPFNLHRLGSISLL